MDECVSAFRMNVVLPFWLREAPGRRRESSRSYGGAVSGKQGDGEPALLATVMDASEFDFLFEPTVVSDDVVRLILTRLRLPVLARAACVSRNWRLVATDPAVLMECFKTEWKLREVVGRPKSSRNFFHRGLRQFAISHPLQRWDMVDSLAVKYDVQVCNRISLF